MQEERVKGECIGEGHNGGSEGEKHNERDDRDGVKGVKVEEES